MENFPWKSMEFHGIPWKFFTRVSSKLGYEILHVSNDEITPVTEMDYEDNQKLVIFDDYVCDKN